jgi:hypothetical protein
MTEDYDVYTVKEVVMIDNMKKVSGNLLEDEEIYEMMEKHKFNEANVRKEVIERADLLRKKGGDYEWTKVEKGTKKKSDYYNSSNYHTANPKYEKKQPSLNLQDGNTSMASKGPQSTKTPKEIHYNYKVSKDGGQYGIQTKKSNSRKMSEEGKAFTKAFNVDAAKEEAKVSGDVEEAFNSQSVEKEVETKVYQGKPKEVVPVPKYQPEYKISSGSSFKNVSVCNKVSNFSIDSMFPKFIHPYYHQFFAKGVDGPVFNQVRKYKTYSSHSNLAQATAPPKPQEIRSERLGYVNNTDYYLIRSSI